MESAWLNIADNKCLSFQSEKTLVETVNSEVRVKYHFQTHNESDMTFKCGKFLRKGKQMLAGFQCHAKIKVSKDMQRYKVVKNPKNDNIVWHKHSCMYRKTTRINSVVAHLEEKTLTLKDELRVEKDEQSVK